MWQGGGGVPDIVARGGESPLLCMHCGFLGPEEICLESGLLAPPPPLWHRGGVALRVTTGRGSLTLRQGGGGSQPWARGEGSPSLVAREETPATLWQGGGHPSCGNGGGGVSYFVATGDGRPPCGKGGKRGSPPTCDKCAGSPILWLVGRSSSL